MGGRHLQTLIAVVLAGLWGTGVHFAHDRGHLRFLDRIESTMTDFRTLVRGVKVPPDVVTIVAIDDAVVNHGGSYRADLARIVDAIAELQPKVIAVDLLLIDRGINERRSSAGEIAGRPPQRDRGGGGIFASQSVDRGGR